MVDVGPLVGRDAFSSPWPGKDKLEDAIMDAARDEAQRLAKMGIGEEEIAARIDAYVYGIGYTVNGKRVDPTLVHIWRRQPVPIGKAEWKRACEEFQRPYQPEPFFFTNIRRAWNTLRRVAGGGA